MTKNYETTVRAQTLPETDALSGLTHIHADASSECSSECYKSSFKTKLQSYDLLTCQIGLMVS